MKLFLPRTQSIRFKTRVLFTVILGAILAIYSMGIFFAVRKVLIRDMDDELRIKAQEVAQVISAYERLQENSSEPRTALQNLLEDEKVEQQKMLIDDLWRTEFEALNLKQDFIHILNKQGHLLLYSGNMTEPMARDFKQLFRLSTGKEAYADIENSPHHLRAVNYPFAIAGRLSIVIQVATPRDAVNRILNEMALSMFFGVVLILGITSFLGTLFVRRILRPVTAIIKTADHITHKDLSIRISQKEIDLELKLLIDSLNGMIERLEQSFAHISEFSSHVAHELKTPLAIIRGEMELALEQDRAPQEYKKTLENCLGETQRLIRIVRDLLLLAKLDYRPEVFKFEAIDLRPFMDEIYEQGRILASAKNIAVTMNARMIDGISIHGDRVHLRRLLFNIIGNAVKFTPVGGKIDIELGADGDKVTIAVTDTGIGIAPEHLDKIFDKFYKIHQENAPDSETGSGLGLSIALSIAKAHQGNISVKSQPGQGSTFTFVLPRLS